MNYFEAEPSKYLNQGRGTSTTFAEFIEALGDQATVITTQEVKFETLR